MINFQSMFKKFQLDQPKNYLGEKENKTKKFNSGTDEKTIGVHLKKEKRGLAGCLTIK